MLVLLISCSSKSFNKIFEMLETLQLSQGRTYCTYCIVVHVQSAISLNLALIAGLTHALWTRTSKVECIYYTAFMRPTNPPIQHPNAHQTLWTISSQDCNMVLHLQSEVCQVQYIITVLPGPLKKMNCLFLSLASRMQLIRLPSASSVCNTAMLRNLCVCVCVCICASTQWYPFTFVYLHECTLKELGFVQCSGNETMYTYLQGNCDVIPQNSDLLIPVGHLITKCDNYLFGGDIPCPSPQSMLPHVVLHVKDARR